MLTVKRSDFFYTLKEDERKCLASIQRVEERIRARHAKNAFLILSSQETRLSGKAHV